MSRISLLFCFLASFCFGQAPDCLRFINLTAGGTSTAYSDNRNTGCTNWTLAYDATGFSALSLRFESAEGGGATPGSFGAFSGTVTSGINPNTNTVSAISTFKGYVGWFRVTLQSVTGTGQVIGVLYGRKDVYTPVGGTGGVTSLSTGCGLSGGPITTTGTIILSELVRAQTGTTYTVLNSDCGKLVTFSNAMAISATLPQAGGGGNFAAGWVADFQNRGAGTLTITPTVSTIDGAASLALSTGQGVRIVSDGTNYFTERGTGNAGTVTSISSACGVGGGPITSSGTLELSQTVNAQASTSYTFLDSDCGKLVTFSNAMAIAAALPQAGAGGLFVSGWVADIQNRGAGTLTITPAVSTIDGAASLALTTGQGIRVFSDGTNYFTERGVGGGGSGVTSVSTGCGVTGGPITTTGTVSLSQVVNAQAGTSYTFLNSDCGKLVTFSNALAIAAALPQAGAGGLFVSGWVADIQNRGAGTLTITPAVSTIDGAASLALTTGQGIRLFSDGTNYFTERGTGTGGGGGGSASRGLFGSRSSCASAGNTYYSTDVPIISECNGTGWADWVWGYPSVLPSAVSFTWRNQGGASVTSAGIMSMAVPANPSASLRGQEIALPSTPFTLDACFRINESFAVNTLGALYVTDGTKLITFGPTAQSNISALNVFRWTNVTTFSSTSKTAFWNLSAADLVCLRWNDDGTNMTLSIGLDGLNWVQYFQESRTAFLTPTNIGWLGSSESTLNTVVTLTSWNVH